ncbi:MAG TPA: hypothetical protein VF767_07230 [Bryobacteraceae bacterium]
MPNVFVFGHGGWTPSDGYTQVPANTSIRFFTEANRLMSVDFAVRLMSGTAGVVEPDLQVGAYHSVQNLRLHPAPEFHGQVLHAIGLAGVNVQIKVVQNPAGVRLQNLLAQLKGNDITWIACRALQLQVVRTRIGGVQQRIGGMRTIQR